MATTVGKLVTSSSSQPADADLTTIAGLTATTNNVMQAVSSAWASRTPAQLTATLPAFASGTAGLAPASGGGTTNYLRADGSWTAPGGGGGLADGDYGDITVSGVGTVMTIDPGVVTLAKQANMATASLVYRKTAGSGAPEVNTLATLKTDLGLTGTNSGDQTITLTGDVTGTGAGSFAATLATVNGNVGAFGSATQVAVVTANGKGLITALSSTSIAIPVSAISDSGAFGRTLVQTVTAAGARSALGIVKGTATLIMTANAYEDEEVITATGVTPSDLVFMALQAGADTDENVSDMLDLVSLAGTAGTDQITVKIAFREPTSGPILLNWSTV